MAKKLVVAIDGPAGAGKSTVAKKAAQELGYTYIDTGAMYRAVAWKVMQSHDEVTEAYAQEAMQDVSIDLQPQSDGTLRVLVDGEDVTEAIRTPEISAVVSQVASYAAVRERLVYLQREMATKGGVLMDGRDIATNVLPHADVKIFLTASLEARAQRRAEELRQKGFAEPFEKLKTDIARRDKADMERKISPLRQAKDAVLLDTTHLTIAEAVQAVLERCKNHAL